MKKEDRLKLFSRELSYIKDNNYREFCEKLIEDANEYFFHQPASSTGKYHPAFSNGNGGLLRHTKAVVYFLNELLRAETEFKDSIITPQKHDMMIVAAICHDIKKYGDSDSGDIYTSKDHAETGAKYIESMHVKYPMISDEDSKFITDLVRTHMGPWSSPAPSTPEQKLLFYADYIASRKDIMGLEFLEGEDTNISSDGWVPPVEAPSEPLSSDTYVFNFGKTKGMTLKESYEKEPGYLRWLAGVPDFSKPDVQNLVKEFLKTV